MKGPALGIIVTIIAVGGIASDIGRESDGPRQTAQAFHWVAPVPAGQQIWIRNLSGRIDVHPATGDQLEVVGERSWRRSDPDALHFVALPHEGGVTICALWHGAEAHCGPQGEYRMSVGHEHDLSANITVSLPRGVRLDASTESGRITVAGAAAPVRVKTGSGRIEAHTAVGPVVAHTTSGSITVSMDSLAGTGPVELETMSGSITARLPARLDALLDARTVHGRIETDYELTLTGRLDPRHVTAQIGRGGRAVRLRTVSGSISIERAGRADSATAAARPRPPRRPPEPRVRVQVRQH